MRTAIGVLCATMLLAPAAHARQWFGGVVPDVSTSSQWPSTTPASTTATTPPLARIANLPYHGGPVLHSNRTHVIFWQPARSGMSFDAGYESLIKRFLTDVAADSHRTTNVYSLSGQYHDARGPAAYASTFAGPVVAADHLPRLNSCAEPATAPHWTHCVDDQQLEGEIDHVVRSRRLPQTGHDIYFIVTPNGLGSCEFTGPDNCALGGATAGSYCGYHSSTPDGLLYAVIPYNAVDGHCQSENPRPNASTADPMISTLSHEHNETVTDPLGNAWIDSSFEEDGDLCLIDYGEPLGGGGEGRYNEVIHHHHYYLQEEWSNRNRSCQQRARPEHTSVAAPNRARAGVSVSFTGHASDPNSSIVSYRWLFSRDRSGHGRRVNHVFHRPGLYRIELHTTDRDALWAFSTHTIRIAR